MTNRRSISTVPGSNSPPELIGCTIAIRKRPPGRRTRAASPTAPGNDMAPILLCPDPPREADVVDPVEDHFDRLADGDGRRIDLVDLTVRTGDQVARETDRRILLELDDDRVVRRLLRVGRQQRR